MNDDCIFCRITRREAPASFIYEDESIAAFSDIRPINPGHSLVIPRRHAANLAELDPADGGRIFEIGQRLAAGLRASGLRCEGVNFHLADGIPAGQEVFHVHLHVIPRFAGDALGVRRRLGTGLGSATPREELDGIAARIKSAGFA